MSARPRSLALLAVGVVAFAGAGCFDEPPIEDRWTRVDMAAATFVPTQPVVPGAPCSVSVHTTITYRAIVTGYVVTELRATGVYSPTTLPVGPNVPRVTMAQAIDDLLRNSAPMGRSVRAITGWDHLIQPMDMAFTGWVPTVLDSAGGAPGSPISLFLVSYLASGEEIELADGSDSVVVTPFVSSQAQVLPVGMPVLVAGAP